MSGIVDQIDEFQRRHRAVAFTYAVFRRYGEDRGGWLCAAISYYGFFSLFPALLAFVTIVYWALGSRPTLLANVLAALWATLPFVGESARRQVVPIAGTGPVLVVSLLISLWAALGVVRALEDASNLMWCVPRSRRPGFVAKLARGAAVLALVAGAILLTGVLTATSFTVAMPAARLVLTTTVSIVVDIALVLALLRVLTSQRIGVHQLWPGALVAGASLYLLTVVGGFYVQHVVARASAIYGSFATVIGLFAWISLLAQAFVLASLVNVVRTEGLWPRTTTGRNMTDGDRRAEHLTRRRATSVENRCTGAIPRAATGPNVPAPDSSPRRSS